MGRHKYSCDSITSCSKSCDTYSKSCDSYSKSCDTDSKSCDTYSKSCDKSYDDSCSDFYSCESWNTCNSCNKYKLCDFCNSYHEYDFDDENDDKYEYGNINFLKVYKKLFL